MHYPQNNGNNLIFTNQYPQGNLKNPTGRTTNIPLSYSATNYFTLYNVLSHRSIDQDKIMLYNTTPGVCGGAGSIVTYKTLDSRVVNTAPTRNQISDKQTYKFHNGSILANFYTNTLQNLSGTKTNIITATQQFTTTGVVNNLSAIQQQITTYNQGAQNIRDFNITSLGRYDTDEIAQLVATRTESNISLVTSLDIHNKISRINTGLLDLLDTVDTTTLENTITDIQNIQQQEKLKNQEAEILTTRKTDIFNNLTSIKTKYNIMKATFLQAQSMYTSLGRLTTDIT